MTYPINFGGLASGNQPLSDFDTMFTVTGQQGNIPTTAAGTNAITLTPGTNYFAPAAYTNAQIASFKAVNTSSGAVTLQIGGLGLLKLFTPAGIQAASGDVVSGNHYAVQYWSDLDSSSGGFLILNTATTSVANPVSGSFRNLLITNNAGTANTKADMSCDAVVMQNAGGGTVRSTSVAVTVNFGVNGANGLDTGSIASNTFYYMYFIFNSTTVTTAGLASTSSSSPTLPSGYTYFARMGTMRTAIAAAQLYGTVQRGRKVQFVVGLAQTVKLVSLSSGNIGGFSTTSPTLVAVPTYGVLVPSLAMAATFVVTNNITGAGLSNVLVAPTTSYGGANNGPLGSGGMFYPAYLTSGVGGSTTVTMLQDSSTSIGAASDAAGYALSVLGWEEPTT
jgi:hypothetical protein